MITVLGSINLDLIGGVERLPRPGETIAGGRFQTAAGGKGANQALAAARAGAPVRMVGAVGRDGFADDALALLRSGGVDLSRVRQVDEPTGVALIMVDAAGENVIAVIAGANAELRAADAEDLIFAPEDILLLQLEAPVPAMAKAARRARAAGARVLLNLAPFRSEAVNLLEDATHLIVNERECELVTAELGLAAGTRTEDQAAALAGRLGLTVVATLGRDGAVAFGSGRRRRSAALEVDAVDTVGAGDAFCGYLAAGLAEGLDLDHALTLATTAGSLACTKRGAQPSIPQRREVHAALPGRLSR